jgi:hypothetical protein
MISSAQQQNKTAGEERRGDRMYIRMEMREVERKRGEERRGDRMYIRMEMREVERKRGGKEEEASSKQASKRVTEGIACKLKQRGWQTDRQAGRVDKRGGGEGGREVAWLHGCCCSFIHSFTHSPGTQ